MRCLVAVIFVVYLTIAGAASAFEEPAKPSAATQAEPAEVPATDSAASERTEANKPDDRWRFRHHQGIWWYWLPANRWVYWTGDKWLPYDEAGYAEFYRSRHPAGVARGYTAGHDSAYPENQTGYWGTVRHDRFGNRQYPYSSRRGGLQQLGPVPAMGGVRSLPGWGGER